MKALRIRNKFHTFFPCDFGLLQSFDHLSVSRISGDYIFSPLCPQNPFEGFCGLSLPVLISPSNSLCSFRNMYVRSGHHIECLFINHNIWSQNIQKCKQIIITGLQRRCRQHDNSIGIITEILHAFILEGLFLLHTAVSDMMRLIDDNQIKVRSRIQIP